MWLVQVQEEISDRFWENNPVKFQYFFAYCLLPIVLDFTLPTFLLLQCSFVAIPNWDGESFLSDTSSSVPLAGIISISLLTLGLPLNSRSRLSKRKRLHISSQLFSLGDAFTGSAIGLGFNYLCLGSLNIGNSIRTKHQMNPLTVWYQ